MSRVTYGSRPYYCVIFEGYIDPEGLLPGVHLWEYGIFFLAKTKVHAREIRNKVERSCHCSLGAPELFINQAERKPDPIKVEKSLPTHEFPELFFEL